MAGLSASGSFKLKTKEAFQCSANQPRPPLWGPVTPGQTKRNVTRTTCSVLDLHSRGIIPISDDETKKKNLKNSSFTASHQLLVEQQDFFLQLLHLQSSERHQLVPVLHLLPQVAAVKSSDVVRLPLSNKSKPYVVLTVVRGAGCEH